MKKWISFSLVSSFLVFGCSTTAKNQQTKTKTSSSTNWIANAVNRVGYITELNENKEHNYIRKVIEDQQKEYGYRLDGKASLAYRMSYATTRVYAADSTTEYLKAFERLNDNRVGLLFVENKKIFNQLLTAKSGKTEVDLWKEIKNNNVYNGYMVVIGDESQYYLNKEGKVGTSKDKKEWKSEKIATFEFSEIISAYYLGYRTQYTFGKTSDGTKKSVGYMLGSTYELAKDREKNMRKAIAFRQGVLDAEKEHETGPAKFVSKTVASKDKEYRTLVRALSDIEEVVPHLMKTSTYKDQDHSIVYFAGSTPEYNETIASQLIKQEVKNAYGHKLVGEYSSTTAGDLFEASNDMNYMKATKATDEGEEKHLPKQSVTGRIAMFYNKDGRAYRKDDYTKEQASETVIQKVMKTIFKDDNVGKYFNEHTYFGTFGLIYKPGEREVPKNSQAAKKLPEEIKEKLWNKKLTEDMFKDKTFLGWTE